MRPLRTARGPSCAGCSAVVDGGMKHSPATATRQMPRACRAMSVLCRVCKRMHEPRGLMLASTRRIGQQAAQAGSGQDQAGDGDAHARPVLAGGGVNRLAAPDGRQKALAAAGGAAGAEDQARIRPGSAHAGQDKARISAAWVARRVAVSRRQLCRCGRHAGRNVVPPRAACGANANNTKRNADMHCRRLWLFSRACAYQWLDVGNLSISLTRMGVSCVVPLDVGSPTWRRGSR